jgi:pyridoxine 5-phosphate synthase
MVLLGVNIDHVATVRNARGGRYPDPIQAAMVAEAHGADGITAHLREDRRHIRDTDIQALKAAIKTRLNLEMANTEEMVQVALQVKPYMVTLVPERRQELTTEGGLDVVSFFEPLQKTIHTLESAGVRVSLFIDADTNQIVAAHSAGAQIIELHTGAYCEAFEVAPYHENKPETCIAFNTLKSGTLQAQALGIEVNAGHGLNFDNLPPVLTIPGLVELNIGHSLIAESIFTGLGPAVARMKALLA